jgi:hypothetical protein
VVICSNCPSFISRPFLSQSRFKCVFLLVLDIARALKSTVKKYYPHLHLLYLHFSQPPPEYHDSFALCTKLRRFQIYRKYCHGHTAFAGMLEDFKYASCGCNFDALNGAYTVTPVVFLISLVLTNLCSSVHRYRIDSQAYPIIDFRMLCSCPPLFLLSMLEGDFEHFPLFVLRPLQF